MHTIRSVERQDIPALIRLCAEHAAYEEIDFDSSEKEEALRRHLFTADALTKCFVVEQNNRLIGYSTFMKQFSTWDACHYIYMDCLYLKPISRNRGIGKQLLKKVEQYAQSEGCRLLQWQTPTSNERAIRFYHNYGATSKEKERFFLDITV